MKVLAIEREVGGSEGRPRPDQLRAEAQRVWQLYREGVVRELCFRQDQSAAVLMLECDSVEAAEQVLATLPLVRAGLIRFEILPLEAYPGFARLFAVPNGPGVGR